MFPSDDNVDFKVTMESNASPVLDDDPFHLLVLGDWSGRQNGANLGENEFGSQLLEIDRDNFDDVLKKLNLRLDLDLENDGQNVISLRFTELDDFHPDSIFERISVFSDLRTLRERLSKPDTFEKAAAEVRYWFVTESDEDLSQNQIQESVKTYSSSAQLLEDILSKPEQTTSPKVPQTSDPTELSLLVSKLVQPFLVKTDENEKSRLISAVDEAISALMRKILHHPKFKELESAWRGLYFLVRGVETDSKLKIFLFDISKSELSLILKSADDTQEFINSKLVGNDKNWALICGNYCFQINVDDTAMLIRMAKIFNTLNAPFVSYLNMKTADNTAFTETMGFNNLIFEDDSSEAKLWNTIRAIPEAESIGLLIQRLLIRFPYGTETEPTEKFTFEEFSDGSGHDDYLWINPCIALAFLFAQSFSSYGWKLQETLYQDIEGLPVLLYDDAGTSKTIPNSEFFLTEQLYQDMLKLGLMPIINYRNTGKIRLGQVQSIAFPEKPLKGKWN